MPSRETPLCDFGWKAPDFVLPSVDGQSYALADVMGKQGLLLIFMCNHCPYVRSILPGIVTLAAAAIQQLGMGVVAISSNDIVHYPEDAPEALRRVSERLSFPFPYLYDEDQSIAKSYGAVCTPDFFVFNAEKALQYRGRYDASKKESLGTPVQDTDLWQALVLIAETGAGPAHQYPSMGCSIKWCVE